MQNEIKIKETLEKAKKHHEVTLKRALEIQTFEKDLEVMRGGEKNAEEIIESICNGILIQNATNILRALFENKWVREYVEKNMGSDGFVGMGDRDIFIILAKFFPEVQEKFVHPSLIVYGAPHSKNGFQLVLQVHRSVENGYEWSDSSVNYCIYSIDQILCENWMDANPINLAPTIARALLYLQTPETAIQILVEQFHDLKKIKIGHKESPSFKFPKEMAKREGGKKS